MSHKFPGLQWATLQLKTVHLPEEHGSYAVVQPGTKSNREYLPSFTMYIQTYVTTTQYTHGTVADPDGGCGDSNPFSTLSLGRQRT